MLDHALSDRVVRSHLSNALRADNGSKSHEYLQGRLSPNRSKRKTEAVLLIVLKLDRQLLLKHLK